MKIKSLEDDSLKVESSLRLYIDQKFSANVVVLKCSRSGSSCFDAQLPTHSNVYFHKDVYIFKVKRIMITLHAYEQ